MSSENNNNDNDNNTTTSSSTFAFPQSQHQQQQQQPQQQYYFCYECNRTVSITPSSSSNSELLCPNCNGGFLEEVENPNPNPQFSSIFTPFLSPPPTSSSAADQLAPFAPFLFPPSSSSSSSSSSFSPFDPVDLSAIFGGGGNAASFNVNSNADPNPNPRSPFHDSDVFNPFQFLQSYLNTMRAGGANIQFVIENADQAGGGGGGGGVGGGGGNFRLPSNLGDYFFGPGLEQLIQQLAENDPNRYGTPPASKTAVEGLPSVKVDHELLASDSSQCAVCMDEFQLGAKAKQMPCKHVFHGDCLLPWLELHNSCPVCRYELPTDDPDYEQRARGRRENPGSGGGGDGDGGNGGGSNADGNGGGGGVEEGSQNDRTVERRFRISLPWPFRGGAAEGSNASGESGNERRRENPDFGSETRQEDLD